MVGQTETHLALHDFSKKDIMSLNPYIYIYIYFFFFVIIEFKKLFLSVIIEFIIILITKRHLLSKEMLLNINIIHFQTVPKKKI